MQVIETVAPIAIEDLKIYFSNKDTKYIIDYENSTLQGEKLLTYLGNLDLPCNIKFNTTEGYDELVKTYLKSAFIVNVEVLERAVIDLLLQYLDLVPLSDGEFIQEVEDDLKVWTHRLLSLSVYNMSTIESSMFSEHVATFERDETDDIRGINFVSLLKHKDLYSIYSAGNKITPKYYVKYFEEYMFKGKNLFSYWANENNPMFLMTYNLANDISPVSEYIDARQETLQELSA